MKKLAIITSLAALSLIALASAHGLQAGTWMQQRSGRMATQRMIRELNLSDDQRAGIKAILQKEKPAIQSLLSQFAQENAQLRSKNSFDEAFVRSVAQQRAATMTEALVEKEKVRAQIFSLLTPTQQQKANQMGAQIRSMIQDRISTLGDQL